jgi:hypothetical protein
VALMGNWARYWRALEPGGVPVPARVAGREVPVGQAPDRLAVAELVVVVDDDEVVAAPTEFVDRCVREAGLEGHLHAVNPAEPRPVTCSLWVLAVVGDAHTSD